jgi:hypothetical protein
MNQSSRLPGWLAAGGHTGEEPAPAPEPARDALLLDIGGDTGALAIYTSAERDRTEIEVSPAGDDHARTHNVVRSRQTGSATRHAAVFPALPAGDYAVWSDAVTQAGTVTIHGGHVTEFRLRLACGQALTLATLSMADALIFVVNGSSELTGSTRSDHGTRAGGRTGRAKRFRPADRGADRAHRRPRRRALAGPGPGARRGSEAAPLRSLTRHASPERPGCAPLTRASGISAVTSDGCTRGGFPNSNRPASGWPLRPTPPRRPPLHTTSTRGPGAVGRS